jgi:hypothetical protein
VIPELMSLRETVMIPESVPELNRLEKKMQILGEPTSRLAPGAMVRRLPIRIKLSQSHLQKEGSPSTILG